MATLYLVHNEKKEVLTKEKLMNSPLTFPSSASTSSSSATTNNQPDSKQKLLQKLREQSVANALSSSSSKMNTQAKSGVRLMRNNLLGVRISSSNANR